MPIVVHHTPANGAFSWSMRAWQAAWDGNKIQDGPGIVNGSNVDFELPDLADPRTLQFRFHWTSAEGGNGSEPDAFIRRIYLPDADEIWTFESSGRVLYENPYPVGIAFHQGDQLIFKVITQNAFRGGRMHIWDAYDLANQAFDVSEALRDDVSGISTFVVALLPWMTTGFHLMMMNHGINGQPDLWEPQSSIRVWRPSDGASLYLKSGQCDVRNEPLSLTPIQVQVLYSARLAEPPEFALIDLVEGSSFSVFSKGTADYQRSPIFKIATYSATIYPQASYAWISQQNLERPPIPRPFPADPTNLDSISRCALGASIWIAAFPEIATISMAIQPQKESSFATGLAVQVSLGNGSAYEVVAAKQLANGSWQAAINVAINTTTALDLVPTAGPEPKPYDWLDTSRYVTATDRDSQLFTTEGVYGICMSGPTLFVDPPNRESLMQAVFGNAVVGAGVFLDREMPLGANVVNGSILFAVHAPHAVRANLVLVDQIEDKPVRKLVPMTLTTDTFYWWCSIPFEQAAPGTKYRFLLNDNVEVLDPAARAVHDGNTFSVSFNDDPADPGTSWSLVLDVAAVLAAAHRQPWQTMGWQSLLMYEIHVRRFTNLAAGNMTWFDLVRDELKPLSRLNIPGYLYQLPATALSLMPVSEFSGTVSWGYDPSYYFAIDSFYGGAPSMAQFVSAAHEEGRAVVLDVVYNHSLGSSLMSIAPDVYRNGDYDGDRMNCGHPMVGEYFRQASIYLLRTYNLDGFRFDDTNTIITKCVGGWGFLGMIRSALRAAATAEGRSWPYCVAENSGTNPWDVSNASWGVMDGQWGIDQVYAIKSASYDTYNATDSSLPLKAAMNAPAYDGRPFYQAVRFGESHDMVSGQDPTNIRIAVRPPYRQGLQMAKALGALTLLSNGIPMLFMGQEVGETRAFSFDDNNQWINPQQYDSAPPSDNGRILAWFRQIMGLRNDPSKGLQGESNDQSVATGTRIVAFTCGVNQSLFAVITFGTPDNQQNSSWLGLPAGNLYKEIFNSSWPVFQVEFEQEQANGGYQAQISSGDVIRLPTIGAVVLERI